MCQSISLWWFEEEAPLVSWKIARGFAIVDFSDPLPEQETLIW